MSELLTTHFVKSGRFDVVERARLYQLLNEKKIEAGTGVLGEQAKAIGSELGVAAIVVGGYAPSAYGYEVSARVVSVADGSIMTTENALVPADPAWMDQSMGILAAKLSAPWSKERGYVLDVFLESDKLPLLMVDLGTAQGARVGRKLEVLTSGDPVIHPVTKENLGTRDILLANAAVVQTQKEFSYARVLDRAGVVSTPVRMDREGIDIGIERMQRVRLLDENSDVTPDADLSVLSVMKYVQISSDVPDAKLLVDGKVTPLSNTGASVRLGAGTHLIELQVEQMLLSREVTVTKQAVRPKEVAFRKTDLASAVAVKPPDTTPPAEGTTALSRTAPEMTAEDRKADEKLLAMLPKPEVIDEQLRAARDEAVTSTFEAGLRALRYGYARGNRSYLSIAVARFADVTRLAPELALGYFNLGLAKFYLDYLDDAKDAFDHAVKLDKSLEEDVPLLWWESFAAPPAAERVTGDPRSFTWHCQEGILTTRVDSGQLCLQLCTGKRWPDWSDTRTAIRFRVVQGNPELCTNIRAAEKFPTPYLITVLGRSRTAMMKYWHRSVSNAPSVTLGYRDDLRLRSGWHTYEIEASGTTFRSYLDGDLLQECHDGQITRGTNVLVVQGDGTIDISWVLVTRY